MKEIDKMSKQQIIDEIVSLEIELESIKNEIHDDETFERLYESAIDRLYDLDYAKTHNFPKLI